MAPTLTFPKTVPSPEARDAAKLLASGIGDESLRVLAQGGEVHGSDGLPSARDMAYGVAFKSYLRRGFDQIDGAAQRTLASRELEKRDLGIATGGAGGFMVPASFVAKLTQVQKYAGGMRGLADVLRVATGRSAPSPVTDDTANAAVIVNENTTLSPLDTAFTSVGMQPRTYAANLIRASHQLVNDASFDLETELADVFVRRLDRGQAPHFINGTGGTQPTGVLPGATVGVTLPTGNTTTMTYAGLEALYFSLDRAYRENGTWVVADNTLKAILTIVDGAGRPVIPYPQSPGDPFVLFGRPIVTDPNMPVPAASAKTILFGDWSRAYRIIDVGAPVIRRLQERYAEVLQVAYMGYQRTDAGPVDPKAVVALQQSAS
jgi:HK97 family phage major capsid protein